MSLSPPRSFSSPVAIARFGLVFAALLAADLLSKQLAFDRLMVSHVGSPPGRVEIDSRTIVAVPKLLHFHLTANQGAVFGIGQGRRWLFVLVSVAAVAFLLYLFGKTRPRQWPTQLLLAGLLAGVIGNMYDRLAIGYVRDMLWMLPHIRWRDLLPFLPDSIGRFDVFPWIFNLADSYLVMGVTIVLIHSLFSRTQVKTDGSANAGSADVTRGESVRHALSPSEPPRREPANADHA